MTDLATLGFAAALLLGLSFGATACSIACVPLIGPALLGRGGGGREQALTVALFSLGRISGYTAMAGASALFGHWLADQSFPLLMRLFVGGGTVLLGGLLLLRAGRRRTCTPPLRSSSPVEVRLQLPAPSSTRRGPHLFGAYLTGLGMAFSPCAPLGTVLLAAAASGSLWAGLSLGAAFGLGAAVVPALLLGLGISALGRALRQQLGRWKIALERTAGLFLLALGGLVLLGWVSL